MAELANDLKSVTERFIAFVDDALALAPDELKAFYFEWDITYYTVNYISGGLYGYNESQPEDLGSWEWESIDGWDECEEDDDTFFIRKGSFFGFWYKDETPLAERWYEKTTPQMLKVIKDGLRQSEAVRQKRGQGKRFFYAQHDEGEAEFVG